MQNRTLSSDLEKLVVELTEVVRSRYYGKYRGTVKEVGEDAELGCIKAEVPEVYGETRSPWANPVIPFAGPNYGLVLLPQKEDGVWIEFEAGDISRPIWTGFWWNKDEIPEPAGKDTRVLVTPNGHKIIVDDDKNELHLLHASGPEIKLTEDEISLKNESSQVVLKSNEVNINDGALVVK